MKITRSTSTSDEYQILDEKNRKNLSACYSWTCHALFAISCIVIIWFIDAENSRTLPFYDALARCKHVFVALKGIESQRNNW